MSEPHSLDKAIDRCQMAMDLCFNKGDRDNEGWEEIKRLARLGAAVDKWPSYYEIRKEGYPGTYGAWEGRTTYPGEEWRDSTSSVGPTCSTFEQLITWATREKEKA